MSWWRCGLRNGPVNKHIHFDMLKLELAITSRNVIVMDEVKFGEQIRRARLIEDVTQEELARRANVSQVTLSKLESGKGSTLTTIVKVLQALGRDDWLGTLEPEPEVSPLRMAREAANLSEPRRASRRAR